MLWTPEERELVDLAIEKRSSRDTWKWDWMDFLFEALTRYVDLDEYNAWWATGVVGG